MSDELEGYISVKPEGGRAFYFIDNAFCPSCGKRGMWKREDCSGTYDWEKGLCVCTSCRNQMRIIDMAPVIFTHQQNVEIFDDLFKTEKVLEESRKLNGDGIDCLEALTI